GWALLAVDLLSQARRGRMDESAARGRVATRAPPREPTMSASRWAVALVALMVTACGMETKRVDPDQDDAIGGTGFDAADVRKTADLMARSLLDRPELFAKGTPFVVIESPDNRTRFQIDSSIFV